MTAKTLRVLHVPHVVGGNAIGLARAERELGLDSVVVSFEAPPAGFEADEVLFAGRGRTTRELQRWRLLLHALTDADVVHFNFGSTILQRYWPSAHGGARAPYGWYARLIEGLDLRLLRRAGKGIVVTYQGDDARQGPGLRERLDAPWIDALYNAHDDARKQRAIARFDRYAHAIFFLNPDLLDVLPARAEFLPYAATDLRDVTPVPAPHNSTPVLAHLPSDRKLKGSDAIIAAAAAVDAELLLVEQMPHADALAALASADLVVDQILFGWYGAVAVEAMALARPVVAHLHAPDLVRIPEAMRADLPVIDATPETLEHVLRRTLSGDLEELGRRGRAFAERWHDPLEIAERLRQVYELSTGVPS